MKIEPGQRVLLKAFEEEPPQRAVVLGVEQGVITVEIDPSDRPDGDPDGLREIDADQICFHST